MKHAIADRTFECRMCGRDYKSITGRNIHMKMKHEVKDDETKAYISYDCEQCECVYRSKNGLRNHMEKVHRRTKPLRSAMKIKTKYTDHLNEEIIKEMEGEVTVDQIFTDINTLLNSSPSRRHLLEKYCHCSNRMSSLLNLT